MWSRADRLAVVFVLSIAVFSIAVFSADPAEATGAWAPFGFGGGEVRQLFADPVVSGRLYAVTGGRLYRSDDRGDSWTWCPVAIEGLRGVSFDPAQGGTLYALSPFDQHNPRRLSRSIDGCRHWEEISSTVPWDILTITPVSASTFYSIKFGGGLFRSDDGGQSWREILEGNPTLLRAERMFPDTIYVGDEGILKKSVDGGSTWRPLPLPALPLHLEIAPSRPNVLYAVGADPFLSLWSSDDGGETWRERTPFERDFSPDVLAVDPTDPQTVWVGGYRGTEVSRDGGVTWRRTSSGLPAFNAIYREPWVVSLAFDPLQPQTLYAGNSSAGVSRSVDGGDHWQTGAQQGLAGNFIRHLRFDPREPGTMYLVGSTSLGLGLATWTQDGGETWTRFPPSPSGQGPDLVEDVTFDPKDPGAIYVSSRGRLFRSEDRGQSWTIPTRALRGPLLFVDEALLVGRRNLGIWRSPSRDGGGWREVLSGSYHMPDGDWGTRNVNEFLSDPAEPSTIYANVSVFEDQCLCSFPQLYRSLDSGATWHLLRNHARALALGGGRPAALYVLLSKFQIPQALRSTDRGGSWQTLSQVPGLTDLAVDPRDPRILYASSATSRLTFQPPVQRSRDGGKTWKPFSPGFGRWGVDSIDELEIGGGRLYAFPPTGGIFAIDLEDE